MSFTALERSYIDIGLPCPMHWSMALNYIRLLLNRSLTYDEAIDVLGYRPDIDHPYVREWVALQGPFAA